MNFSSVLCRSRPMRALSSLGLRQPNFSRYVQTRAFSSYPEHEVVGMPALSPTMEMGTISKWTKQEGEEFQPGDVICQVETDKAVVDFEAQDEGYVAKILQQEGTVDIPVGKPIFVSVEDANSIAAFTTFQLEDEVAESIVETSAAAVESRKVLDGPPKSTPISVAVHNSRTVPGGRVFASPLARKIARENNISLSNIAATGPRGRIVVQDVQTAIQSGVAFAGTAIGSPKDGAYHEISLSEYARALAAQLTQQKSSVPHYHLSCDIDLDELLFVRESINKSQTEEEQLSVNDFLIFSAGRALMQVPEANSTWMGNAIRQYHNADINVLMSMGNQSIAPVIREVNHLKVTDISAQFRDLMRRTSTGELSAEDLNAGTFTICNAGMFGVKSLSAIVSPGQSCSLGLGVIEKVLAPSNEGWSSANTLESHIDLSLHR